MANESAPAPACPPDRYATLRVRGRDAASFLQGQLTQDVLALEADAMSPAALLTPQGRVLGVLWIERAPDGFGLVLPGSIALAVGDGLRRYVLRSKVTIEPGPLEPASRARFEAALRARGAPSAAVSADIALALVAAGLPEIGREASEEWIPQMLNLDLIGAVSFAKGCYTGQEIVARTQHLGRIKRRMFRLALAGPPPAVKSALLADGVKAGEVVLAAAASGGAECLAVLNLEARARPLALADGRGCRLLPLPYAVP
jgi:tRNA-modifying protein YgfZ